MRTRTALYHFCTRLQKKGENKNGLSKEGRFFKRSIAGFSTNARKKKGEYRDSGETPQESEELIYMSFGSSTVRL